MVRVGEVEGLALGNWLEEGVDPNAKRVGEACAVRADGSGLGAFGARLVNLGHYVKVTKGLLGILSQLAGEEVGGFSANARSVLLDPGVDALLQCSHLFPSLRGGEELVGGVIQKVLFEAPFPDVDGEISSACAKALIRRSVGDGVVRDEVVQDALLELGEVGLDLEGAREDSLDFQLKAGVPAINFKGLDGRPPD